MRWCYNTQPLNNLGIKLDNLGSVRSLEHRTIGQDQQLKNNRHVGYICMSGLADMMTATWLKLLKKLASFEVGLLQAKHRCS